jgi:hypothetical protein
MERLNAQVYSGVGVGDETQQKSDVFYSRICFPHANLLAEIRTNRVTDAHCAAPCITHKAAD